jgi:Terminase large subunit, T4likevirus-type, N-terminal
MSLLDELVEKFTVMPEGERADIAKRFMPLTAKMRFIPNPGPQTEAYNSDADILLYGGQAGGGKSFLLVGLASQEHRRSIIFRRELAQTDGLEDAGKSIIGDSARFVGAPLPEWNWLGEERSLTLAGMKDPGDWNKHAGRERDFYGFDEAGEFTRDQVNSLVAWNRGPDGQRCRIVLASNPPRTSDGYWMQEWFAPWLDPHYARPAEDGELRWAVLIDGSPLWVDGPEPITLEGADEPFQPMSFTFIRAELKDNPYRNTPEYRAKLNSLPEPLRSQLLYGNFAAGGEDPDNQLIPTQWIVEAQQRWTSVPPVGIPLCAIGVDVAQGGADQSVVARRHDGWFAPLETIPGVETPSGQEVAGKVIAKRYDGAKVVVDLGGGWGGDALKHLVLNGVDAHGYMGVKQNPTGRTRDGQLSFFNERTKALWRFREALDPHQQGGSSIALPPDRELVADLAAPTFSINSSKRGLVIKAESKEDVVKRLGRSTDKGDATIICWSVGPKMASDFQNWNVGGNNGRAPKVLMGRQHARRR